MTLHRFFRFLEKHYNEPIEGTHFLVKFYAQCGTFSFEFHDERRPCFNDDSRVYISKVYYGWLDKEVRKDIIDELLWIAWKRSETSSASTT